MKLRSDNKKLLQEIERLKCQCKCGHTVYIENGKRRVLCGWCNRWIYKNKKEEFKDKLMMKINGGN